MAAFRTGDTLVWIIGPVQDDAGVGVTGATWSAVVALRPDGTTFAPTYSELGSGDYLATVVSTMRGLWFLHSTATVNAVVYTDADKFTVDDDGMTQARAAKLDSLDYSVIASGGVIVPSFSGPLYVVAEPGDYTDADTGAVYRYQQGAVISIPWAIKLGMPELEGLS